MKQTIHSSLEHAFVTVPISKTSLVCACDDVSVIIIEVAILKTTMITVGVVVDSGYFLKVKRQTSCRGTQIFRLANLKDTKR